LVEIISDHARRVNPNTLVYSLRY